MRERFFEIQRFDLDQRSVKILGASPIGDIFFRHALEKNLAPTHQKTLTQLFHAALVQLNAVLPEVVARLRVEHPQNMLYHKL